MLKAVVMAAALVAAGGANWTPIGIQPAHAEWTCDAEDMTCVGHAAGNEAWIRLYCGNHPTDPECAMRGYHYAATDPIDQKIDQRLVDRFCADHPTFERCISPFDFWRRKAAERLQNHEK